MVQPLRARKIAFGGVGARNRPASQEGTHRRGFIESYRGFQKLLAQTSHCALPFMTTPPCMSRRIFWARIVRPSAQGVGRTCPGVACVRRMRCKAATNASKTLAREAMNRRSRPLAVCIFNKP